MGEKWQKMFVHNFIWECFHGLLYFGEEIMHLNNLAHDNRLENLKLRNTNEIIIKVCTKTNECFV